MEAKSEPRTCYYILHTQFDSEGFIPSLVTENEEGHRPLIGNGTGAAPYHWGKTLEEAERMCAHKNLMNGITEKDMVEIVASSMFPHKA